MITARPELQDDLAALRRALHAEPELGLDLPRTQEKVLAALEQLPLDVTLGQSLTSVTAVLRGAKPGPTVLLRGDMDALPVAENTGLDFASRNGAMHACGHDLHTAMLAGAARLLSEHRDRLAGNVIFMFQPGEEGGAGAKLMIEEGVLEAAGERPVAAYALHVAAGVLPKGLFVSRSGPALAASNLLRVVVRGQGGHGSTPHNAKDPIPAACEMVTALQTFVTRSFDIFDPVVVTVGRFSAGTASNVIPDEAEFDVTLRTFSAASVDRLEEGTVRLIRGIAAAHGLEAEAEFTREYPLTVNDAAEVAFAAGTIRDLFGENRYVESPRPFPGSEDFSFVLDNVPGAYVALGAAVEGSTAYNHSPEALFDDSVLSDGAALLARLAEARLLEELRN